MQAEGLEDTVHNLRVNGVSDAPHDLGKRPLQPILAASAPDRAILTMVLVFQGDLGKLNVPNEAVNLLKTNVDDFPVGLKAFNLLKTRILAE